MEWGDEELPKEGLLATAMESDEELQKLLKTLQQVYNSSLMEWQLANSHLDTTKRKSSS